MFEEEHSPTATPENGAELTLRGHWLVLGSLAAFGAGGNVEWARDALAALSLVGPVLLLASLQSGDFIIKNLLGRFVGWMLPCLIVGGAFLVGHYNPVFDMTSRGSEQIWELLPLPPAWMPVSGQGVGAVIQVLLTIGLYASALNAFLVPRSRLVYARTWALLVLIAGVLALLGLVQHFSHTPYIFWCIPVDNPRFFANFPHAAQWSAFALLWLGAALGLLAWLVRQRGWRWLSADGWLLLAMAVLLGASIIYSGDPLHRLLAAVVSSVGCVVVAWQTVRDRQKGSGPGLASAFWVSLSLVLLVAAVYIGYREHPKGWMRYAGERPDLPLHERVIEDTKNMWHDRPWFGWGPDSYEVVFGFYQQADEGQHYFASARSDFWQSLAENGVVGTVVWWLPVAWLLLRLVWLRRRLASFLIAPLAALVAIALLAVVDFPLSSPAVYFSFWLILFSAARWTEVDDESTKSQVSDRRRITQLRARGQTLIQPAPGAPSPAGAPPKG